MKTLTITNHRPFKLLLVLFVVGYYVYATYPFVVFLSGDLTLNVFPVFLLLSVLAVIEAIERKP